jgi:hypothetical protein
MYFNYDYIDFVLSIRMFTKDQQVSKQNCVKQKFILKVLEN